ncbi:hypothetical protein BO71DRAFT_411022 [Aspergillus ellipticus CBS 707.79]|uniref:Uncharacterized protein n=1 Tax=Aspergillus ellipticus CBS 707.79 TaxID=1448320 RepID=A0A319D4R2_9EURO|nr:hypothetical protein BO71DRAFT_411022 [Aspergillus ellipticus CBS 707.79]
MVYIYSIHPPSYESNRGDFTHTASQKVSTIALTLAALASQAHAAVPWGEWICHRDGDHSSHYDATVEEFDKLWGTPALTLGAATSDWVKCNGYYFGLVNYASYKWKEKSGQRDTVAKEKPSGNECVWYTSDGENQYYMFSTTGVIDPADGATIRSC